MKTTTRELIENMQNLIDVKLTPDLDADSDALRAAIENMHALIDHCEANVASFEIALEEKREETKTRACDDPEHDARCEAYTKKVQQQRRRYTQHELTLESGRKFHVDNIATFINDAGDDIFDSSVKWVLYRIEDDGETRDGWGTATSKRDAFEQIETETQSKIAKITTTRS
jgi:hypothetical protein